MVELALNKEIEKYKGKLFSGDYPTLSVGFYIISSLYPDNRCFCEFLPEERSYTYSEGFSYVKKAALKLKSIGIGKGDKVAVCGKNSCTWGISFYAANAAGAVIVPIDVLLSKEEVGNIVRRADVKFAFVDKAFVIEDSHIVGAQSHRPEQLVLGKIQKVFFKEYIFFE